MRHIAVNVKHHFWLGHALCCFLNIEVIWVKKKKKKSYLMTDENAV